MQGETDCWKTHPDDGCQVRKTVFFSHLYTITMILPRQARDKHRKNSKKEAVLSQAWTTPEQEQALGKQTRETMWMAPIGHAPHDWHPPSVKTDDGDAHECYWYDGFDARGTGTGWSGPAKDCTAGPKSPKPCTKEDCCAQCQDPSWVDPTTKKYVTVLHVCCCHGVCPRRYTCSTRSVCVLC